MKRLSAFALACVIALTGCSGSYFVDRKFYDAPIDVPASEIATWYDRAVIVRVRDSLSVSEDPDVFFPRADIDWWEDPPGDRHDQVEDIVHTALHNGVAYLNGPKPVVFVADVEIFHALTPRSRRDGLFGWHDITYRIWAYEEDGTLITGPHNVYADLKAFQRQRAVRAEAAGITQKSRISEHIAKSIRAWLESAE